MSTRRADVFFYGLFMDPDLLREKGFAPENVELASVSGFALRVGSRAALVPDASGIVFGSVMSLTLAELQRLYSQPGLEMYKPQAVLARLQSGGVIAALCYNLPEPPAAAEYNKDYAAKLRAIARKIGLPTGYIESLP